MTLSEAVPAKMPAEFIKEHRSFYDEHPHAPEYPCVSDMEIGVRKYVFAYEIHVDSDGYCWINSNCHTFNSQNSSASVAVERRPDGIHAWLDRTDKHARYELPRTIQQRVDDGGSIYEDASTFSEASTKLIETMNGISSTHSGRWAVQALFFRDDWEQKPTPLPIVNIEVVGSEASGVE